MRKIIPLFVFALVFLEVSTLKLGRNTDNSENDVEDIGAPLDIEYYSKLPINKTELNPEGIEVFAPEELFESSLIEESRNIINDDKKWPGAVMPYTIDARFSEQQKGALARAMARLQSVSCIQFKPRTNEVDYIHIARSSQSCSSSVGRIGGKQTVRMSDACFWDITNGYAVALHEFLHAAGFWHQQSSPDRDEYIKINFENVFPGTDYNFKLLPGTRTLNVPYDYCSIMHYDAYAFSKNGKPTIEKLKSSGCVLDRKTELSDGDIRKLNLLYNCNPCGGNDWNYHTSSGKCYQIVNVTKTWQEARLACQALPSKTGYKSDLTVIKSQAENDFIHSLLQPWQYWNWIGLHDSVNENQFQWIDGSNVDTFNNFAYGEPNNDRNEDCVELNIWNKWNDWKCDFELDYPICQQFIAQ